MKKVLLVMLGAFALAGCELKMTTREDDLENPGDTNDPDNNPGDTNDPDNNPGDTNDPDNNPGDTNDPDDNPGDSNTPDPAPTEPVDNRVVMTELEIRDYLEDRTFLVSTHLNNTPIQSAYGSGWLFDESEDNWYIATNRHVTEIYTNDPGYYEMCITNKWEEMRAYYDYDTAPGDDKYQNVAAYQGTDTAVQDVVYPNCMEGEVVYENEVPNSSYDYYDFAVVKVSKSDVNSTLTDDIDPLVIKKAENSSKDLGYHPSYTHTRWEPVYNLSSGRRRWGSFFNETHLINHNNTNASYLSDYIGSGFLQTTEQYNVPSETGPGSSGSAYVDKYGEVVGIATYNHATVIYPSMNEILNNPGRYRNISGTSSEGILSYIIPEYSKVLNEKTMLKP